MYTEGNLLNQMKIIQNEKVDEFKWRKLLEGNQYATPFQSPEFYTLFNQISNQSAEVYAIELEDQYVALCVISLQKEKGIISFFSHRLIIYGGPLLVADSIGLVALDTLLKNINKDIKRSIIYAEIRNLHDYQDYKVCFIANGWQYESHLNFQLDCSSKEIVWRNLSNNRVRQIKKALKVGVEIKEAENVDQVLDYYSILNDLYKKKIKKPLPPAIFFQKMFKCDIIKFLLVWYQGKIIGGIVCPFLYNKTIYEFYICGLDQEYKEASPSVMATFAAMEYGYNNGLRRFDFMGAGKPNEGYGVRDFKEKFGGKLVEHGRFLKICNPILYKVGKMGIFILQKIH
jgi:lipid II:glycine glycyltransferase (peptidoglycan interpeptide bridge formation enzyme)